MNYVLKIFIMLFGVIVIAVGAVVLTNVLDQTCTPADLFSGENSIAGFGGSFIYSLYDSMCSTFLEANNAIWLAYQHWIVGFLGQRSTVANIAGDLWGIASFFCQTHSNFEFATGGSAGSINDPQVFKELFLYEVERCWDLFQGEVAMLDEARHPIGKQAIFDCAEIIYDFTTREDVGGSIVYGTDSVSLAELTARLLYINSCGEQVHAPVQWATGEDSYIIDSMVWCAPKTLMQNYWSNDDKTFRVSSSKDFSGASVFDFTCNSPSNSFESTVYSSSSCLSLPVALCSFSSISPDYNSGSGSDESTIIDGCGRIVISFYDYFDWGSLWWYQRAGDNYPSCGNLDIFNDFHIMMGESTDLSTSIWPKKRNHIVICYEKYGEGEGCDWLN